MTKQKIEELEFETTSCYIAYDAQSGEILYMHECMKQKGSYDSEADPEEETVLELARAEYDGRNLKVMRAPEGFEMKPELKYHVDVGSGKLENAYSPVMKFRDFLKQAE
jgi:hypothetical protein